MTREDAAFRMVFESDLTSVPQVRSRLDAVELACAEAIAEVIAEDTGADDERALLLGSALAGMAQVAPGTGWPRTATSRGRGRRDDQHARLARARLLPEGRGLRTAAPSANTPEHRNSADAPRVSLSASTHPSGPRPARPTKGACPVEVTIGVQNVARELSLETNADADEVAAAVDAALATPEGILRLTDTKGRTVLVPGRSVGGSRSARPTRARSASASDAHRR